MTPTAIVVLGARVRAGGAAGRALARRLSRATLAALEWPHALVVVCGGRAWDGVVEADVMARALIESGVQEERIARERLSLTTIENLREASRLLGGRNIRGTIALVSCDWHLPRAMTIARAVGLDVIGCPAKAPTAPLPRRAMRALRERVLRALVPFVIIAALLACRKQKPETDAGAAVGSVSPPATSSSAEVVEARVAADRRHSESVPRALSSGDVVARRAAARALSQIGDASAIERLGKSLSDDDAEVIAWSAYGLGLPCDVDPTLARDDRAKIVHAIVARAVGLEGSFAEAPFDPWSAMGWSLGRCGGIEASRELAGWLKKDPARARSAAWALGAIAARDRGLEDDVVKALLEAGRGGLDDALFPFGRGDWSARPPIPGLADVARARLGTAHVLAIRALGRAQGTKVEDLRGFLTDPATPEADRVEALRSLHRMGADAEVAAFATRNAPTDEAKTNALTGAAFGAVRLAVELLGERDPTPTTTTSLRAFIGKAPIPAGASAPLARRLATLRCLAAAALHSGKPGEGDVFRCAAHEAMPAPLAAELDAIRDLARLQTLDRAEVTGEKRDLLVKLARDSVHRVRERALSILGKHAETEEAPDVIIKAFSSKSLGVVAAAAQALAERPSIAFVLSKKAIDKALDPSSPPPDKVVQVDKSFDPKVLEALEGALARPLEEADAEIKTALASAVSATKHARGRAFVMRLCGDRSPALRRAGRDALAHLDPPGKAPMCTAIDDNGVASPYASLPPANKLLKIETDAGAMQLSLDASFAPIAVARIAELAASGFYDGTPIHRVVPGFVVQLGDPTGDGYGGAHVALRCETAPVPFAEGDVGVALAGRDTGSSQIFVMLGRAPHLDGSYARVGHATGDWAKVVEGDHVVRVTVQ